MELLLEPGNQLGLVGRYVVGFARVAIEVIQFDELFTVRVRLPGVRVNVLVALSADRFALVGLDIGVLCEDVRTCQIRAFEQGS